MCSKCTEIDEKIDHYRKLASRVTDDLTRKGIYKLISDLLAEKENCTRSNNRLP